MLGEKKTIEERDLELHHTLSGLLPREDQHSFP